MNNSVDLVQHINIDLSSYIQDYGYPALKRNLYYIVAQSLKKITGLDFISLITSKHMADDIVMSGLHLEIYDILSSVDIISILDSLSYTIYDIDVIIMPKGIAIRFVPLNIVDDYKIVPSEGNYEYYS